jgi:hypothetical protein
MYTQYLSRGKKFDPPPGFAQIDTAFGPLTALKDKRTGLVWLHMNLTAGIPYAQVQHELQKGRFSQWRFASPAEIQQMFADFNGSKDDS